MTHILRSLSRRNADGSDNNPYDPGMGQAEAELVRMTYADYVDGVGAADPNGGRANPRVVSNAVADQRYDTVNSHGVSNLFTFFGQFLDHDLDLTHENHAERISITAPADDPTPGFEGASLSLARSHYASGTGSGATPREHANAITSWVDASNVYGSDWDVMHVLRANDAGGGKSAYLLTGADGNLPTLAELAAANPGIDLSQLALPDGPGLGSEAFAAGDIRANENIALTSMHTIWVREHNHWVDELRAEHPHWSEQELFDAAKIMVEAEMQNVVWNEWLPLLLGEDALPGYGGYDAHADGTIATEFSTAAFRLGHSLLPSELLKLTETGKATAVLDLAAAFFNVAAFEPDGGMDSLLRGLAAESAQELDSMIVDDVRNMLFGERARDLAVLNIMRGRDHGLPSLNEARVALGLTAHDDFADLTSDTDVQQALASVYDSVWDVDLWIGGLAEDEAPGSQLGQTFHEIVLDQFMRLRAADHYYFEHRLAADPDLVYQIKETSFSDIILRTTGIDYFQDDAFVAHDRLSGNDRDNVMKGGVETELMIGWGGRDTVYGRGGDDDLYGGSGNDRLYGGHGDDVLDGEGGHDMLKGGRGADEARGGGGGDVLYGEAGDDVLLGEGGRDQLHGGVGRDWLSGGRGLDYLRGGRGSDTFHFEDGFGTDYVMDLHVRGGAHDVISLSAQGFDRFADVMDHAHNTALGVVINMSGGDKLILVGIERGDLHADLFAFH